MATVKDMHQNQDKEGKKGKDVHQQQKDTMEHYHNNDADVGVREHKMGDKEDRSFESLQV